ncbi:XrtA-associated tyrosine autokinase [Solidesulfovibrio sp.]|uniref:XrtA-associated tyrosine autokinase n=1 Tax=Solidesulfovibrio sp. TaxID=2910990 RepID=UPI0026283510|nr:XrtA-associated tyrosine autokinase [Solidesulfovibrio sp.]
MSRIEDALSKATQRQSGISPPAAWSSFRHENTTLPPPTPVEPGRLSEEKLVVLKNPASLEAEEFRKLKESLVKAITSPGTFNNIVLITSAHHGEGKSLITANLAISLAQEYDHTVMVVDADLRLPSCHRYLDVKPEKGLADCLAEGLDVGSALVKTGIPKLVLLPAGKKTVKNPLELLSSNSMRRLMTEMKQRYPDRILLVDTPPVLLFAETRALSDLADSVVLVVREGECSLEEVRECMTLLNNKVLGLVYNATSYAPTAASYADYDYSSCLE